MKRLDRLRHLQAGLKGIINQWPVGNFKGKRKGFIASFERKGLSVHGLNEAQNDEELYERASEIVKSEILMLKTAATKAEMQMRRRYSEINELELEHAEKFAQELIRKKEVIFHTGDKETALARALIERSFPRNVAFLAAVRVIGKLKK